MQQPVLVALVLLTAAVWANRDQTFDEDLIAAGSGGLNNLSNPDVTEAEKKAELEARLRQLVQDQIESAVQPAIVTEVVQKRRARRAPKGTLFKRKVLTSDPPASSPEPAEPNEAETSAIKEYVRETEESAHADEQQISQESQTLQEMETNVNMFQAVSKAGIPWYGKAIFNWFEQRYDQLRDSGFDMCMQEHYRSVQDEKVANQLEDNKLDIASLGLAIIKQRKALSRIMDAVFKSHDENCLSAQQALFRIAGASPEDIEAILGPKRGSMMEMMATVENKLELKPGSQWAVLAIVSVVMFIACLVAQVGAVMAGVGVGGTLLLGGAMEALGKMM